MPPRELCELPGTIRFAQTSANDAGKALNPLTAESSLCASVHDGYLPRTVATGEAISRVTRVPIDGWR